MAIVSLIVRLIYLKTRKKPYVPKPSHPDDIWIVDYGAPIHNITNFDESTEEITTVTPMQDDTLKIEKGKRIFHLNRDGTIV